MGGEANVETRRREKKWRKERAGKGDDSIDKEKMEKGRGREGERAIRREPEHRYPSK